VIFFLEKEAGCTVFLIVGCIFQLRMPGRQVSAIPTTSQVVFYNTSMGIDPARAQMKPTPSLCKRTLNVGSLCISACVNGVMQRFGFLHFRVHYK
jgi:hypothetical protein